ncbi:arylamine N-acetyltransferase 1 [Lentithecium fluviatile CBS 122367]|uniref:Arylamine N-acetyltransferase 1 n=1 Tax=Lentithecium fluviatile CBS 122367 TaxID=1168545 RepID=A0A6G1JJ20_9PLEO|nr:arylamine N-acetyltransferase 1 [Lentithecium fluviatile CBS 122367]
MSFSAQRPTLSLSQITRYFERLQLPKKHHIYDVSELRPDVVLGFLIVLQRLHLIAIPFENLTLHYSAHRQISIHPEELFKKVIGDDNGRGGYCMENNSLFGMLLRSLGYVLFSAGARVFDGGQWTGWSHMVNIVKIGDKKYHVDVGFGGNGPIVPMPLDRAGPVQTHIKPATARLQYKNIPGNTDPDQRLWVYEHCMDGTSDFQTTYCFTELEFLPSDYAVMNYFTSTSPRTFFTRDIVAVKGLVGDDGELAGTLILGNNDLKWRINGKKEREIKFDSENDRIKALEEHFGIKLGQVERDGIRGLPSQLK